MPCVYQPASNKWWAPAASGAFQLRVGALLLQPAAATSSQTQRRPCAGDNLALHLKPFAPAL